jgi:hypothetical protein
MTQFEKRRGVALDAREGRLRQQSGGELGILLEPLVVFDSSIIWKLLQQV